MTQTLCCATPHRTHSYHTAPNTLCGFFIPPVKQLFISPSPLSVPPSLTLALSFHPPLHLSALLYPSLYFVFMSISYSFVFLKKDHNIAHSFLRMLYMHQYIPVSSIPAKTLDVQYELLLEVRWMAEMCNSKRIKAPKGVCHICPLHRAALTASDDSFHQWHWSVWQLVKEIGEKVPLKFPKVTVYLNNTTCHFNAAVLRRTEAWWEEEGRRCKG